MVGRGKRDARRSLVILPLSLFPLVLDFIMAVLTTSAKTSPFPYAAAAAATFTNKADLVFEDEAVPTILDLDGMKVEGDEAIVLAIAKAGGLSDDSDKVWHY
jgi:glutamyl-tRNA synthetase